MVLSIRTAGSGAVMAAPSGSYTVRPGDELTLYGETAGLEELGERVNGASGDEAHEAAIERHRQRVEQERQTHGQQAEGTAPASAT